MNKNIFQRYMKMDPETPEQKYLFLVDSRELAEAIFCVRFPVVALLEYGDGEIDFTPKSFFEYMDSIAFSGTSHMDYTYVVSCSSKTLNQMLMEYFERNAMLCISGWRLFWKKEYLSNYEYQRDLEKTLKDFVNRMEGPGAADNVTDLSRFHKVNGRGEVTGVFDMEIISYLIETTPMIILNRIPFIYENGVYREDISGIRIKAKIQKLIYREFIKSSTIQRIYELLLIQPEIQRRSNDLNNFPKHWINFRNGFFDVMEWKLLPHDRQYFSINQIPHEFDPEKDIGEGRIMRRFLNEAIPDPTDQETYWQYLGYCMTTDTGFQKFMMIKGQGGTGKSVVIEVTEGAVGEENSVSISIQDLNKRFYATSLFGKLLNACADIPSTALQSIDVLKKAVGEDSVLFERKGHDPTNFRSYAKLLFSANEMPLNLDDKTNAYYRRLLILEMNNIVPIERRDRMLKEKLKGETDYIIMMAMKALRRLYQQGCFSISERGRECIEELYRSADSIKSFLDDRIEPQEGSRINRSRMYASYEEYCRENDRQSHGRSAFFRIMKDKGYRLKHYSDGWFYMDVNYRDQGFVEIDPNEPVPFEQMRLDLTRG